MKLRKILKMKGVKSSKLFLDFRNFIFQIQSSGPVLAGGGASDAKGVWNDD